MRIGRQTPPARWPWPERFNDLAAPLIVAAIALAACGPQSGVRAKTGPGAPTLEAVRIEGQWFGVAGPAPPRPGRKVYFQLPGDSTVPEARLRTALHLPSGHPLSDEAFSVILETELGEEGRIERARILKAPRELVGSEELLAAALRRWRFAPATIAGEPVTVRYNIVMNHLPDS